MTFYEYITKLRQRVTLRVLAAFIIFTMGVVGFVSIADEVRENDTLSFDRWTLMHVHDFFGSKYLDSIIPVLTNLGGTIGIIVIGGLVMAAFWYKRQYRRAFMILSGVGGAVALNLILKGFFERSRPELWQRLVTETSFSFPSGHSMASSALAFSIIAALWFTRYRIWAIVGGLGYMVFIGFTRLYLGVHYPTDVMAGWLVSAAWVALVFILLGKRRVTR